MKKLVAACMVALIAGASSQAFAVEKGDIIVRAGAAMVDPHGDGAVVGGNQLDVKDNTQLGISATYMLTNKIGVGVLGATPFEHDITLGGNKIATTKHLPPTVTVQYHFDTKGKAKPYVGAGLNYTKFFKEKPVDPANNLNLDTSTGLAAEVGVDYMMNKNWGLNAAAWYMDIDTDATLNGNDLGTVEIDPWVYMVGASYKF